MQDWEELKRLDELREEISAGRVFAGFYDSPFYPVEEEKGGRRGTTSHGSTEGFLPTFKMQRHQLNKYFVRYTCTANAIMLRIGEVIRPYMVGSQTIPKAVI